MLGKQNLSNKKSDRLILLQISIETLTSCSWTLECNLHGGDPGAISQPFVLHNPVPLLHSLGDIETEKQGWFMVVEIYI